LWGGIKEIYKAECSTPKNKRNKKSSIVKAKRVVVRKDCLTQNMNFSNVKQPKTYTSYEKENQETTTWPVFSLSCL
jgi:hypothetical protein